MPVELKIKNYRCFPDTRPVTITLKKGFTAFVGTNSSGKSSILKFFYEFRSLFQLLSRPLGNLVQALQGQPTGGFSYGRSVLDPEEVFSNTNTRNLTIEFNLTPLDPPAGYDGPKIPRRLVLTIPRGTDKWLAELHLNDGRFNASGGNFDFKGMILRNHGKETVDLAPIFEVCGDLARSIYIAAFRNAINIGAEENYFDIQVGQAFITSWRAHKTGNIKKENLAAIKITEDIQRIFELDDLDINSSNDGKTLKVVVNRRPYSLSELGSGLAQFILVLANAAIRQPAYLLIDEPELNLHPSLQLDFLTTLGSYAREGVFFATHSVGLARAAAERIYSVRKIAEGESEITDYESTPHLSEFLGELSFSGYKELGFDKVLLVEGKTDVKTMQQLLRFYHKEHQVVMLPLGGSQLINDVSETELIEVKRITDKVSVIIDSERNAPGEPLESRRAAFAEMCRRLGMNCCVLERRAAENYLTDRAVKAVKGEKYRALQPYEKLNDVSPSWSKEENWRIAREMTLQDLKDADLGNFLASL